MAPLRTIENKLLRNGASLRGSKPAGGRYSTTDNRSKHLTGDHHTVNQQKRRP
jgi:hypothetical protein